MEAKIRFFAVIFLVLFLSLGCTKPEQNKCTNKVILQLNWTDDPTFTGEYVAKEKFWFLIWDFYITN